LTGALAQRGLLPRKSHKIKVLSLPLRTRAPAPIPEARRADPIRSAFPSTREERTHEPRSPTQEARTMRFRGLPPAKTVEQAILLAQLQILRQMEKARS